MAFDVKKIHLDNLNRIVGYCENVTDCRRGQQLDYFGEHFTSEQCLERRDTACDNCLKKNSYQVNTVNDYPPLHILKVSFMICIA